MFVSAVSLLEEASPGRNAAITNTAQVFAAVGTMLAAIAAFRASASSADAASTAERAAVQATRALARQYPPAAQWSPVYNVTDDEIQVSLKFTNLALRPLRIAKILRQDERDCQAVTFARFHGAIVPGNGGNYTTSPIMRFDLHRGPSDQAYVTVVVLAEDPEFPGAASWVSRTGVTLGSSAPLGEVINGIWRDWDDFKPLLPSEPHE